MDDEGREAVTDLLLEYKDRIAALEADLASRQGGNSTAWAKLRAERDELREKLKDNTQLRNIIQRQYAEVRDGWKAWHREVSDALGCEFLVRSHTLGRVQTLVAERDEILDAAHLAHADATKQGGVIGTIEFLRAERDAARAELMKERTALNTLLTRLDEMPNPHSNPMRHYYNQMQVWKAETRSSARGEAKP